MVEAGEEWVRSLGFSVFRVRHIVQEAVAGPGNAGSTALARVQIAPEEMRRLSEVGDRLEAGLQAVGYVAVEIDPVGYRSS
jgi:PP-loop superfamily ATP-utilizing enzyme